jgi:hypothetical protein
MKDEALKLALEALEREEYRLRQTGQSQVYSGIGFAITAIKQALAAPVQEPVQEPVASVHIKDGCLVGSHRKEGVPFPDGQYGLWPITTPPAAQPAPLQEPVAWWNGDYGSPVFAFKRDTPGIGLGNLDARPLYTTPPAAQPAVPDAIHHTDLSEHPQYIEGWNDCRAEMLKGMKP